MTASVIGTIAFVLLLVLKPFTEKLFTQSWNYYMGFVPVFFLLFGIEPVSRLVRFIGARFAAPPPEVYLRPMAPIDYARTNITVMPRNLPFVEPAVSYSEQSGAGLWTSISNLLSSVPVAELGLLIAVLWAIGAVLYMAVNVRSYWIYRYALLRHSRPCASIKGPVKVVISEIATTPMMIGFIKPLIILPNIAFTDRELEMILSHELVHFQRKDIWLKLVTFTAQAMHWFNPAVYFLSRHIDTLCELSCDEKVVLQMNAQERKLYGETILLMLQYGNAQRNLVCASGLCNSKKNIKRRLINMLKAKKSRKSVVALSLVMSLLIAGVSGVVAHSIHGATPRNEAPSAATFQVTAEASANSTAAHTAAYENPVEMYGGVRAYIPDADGNWVLNEQTFTWNRNAAFWHALPSYEVDRSEWDPNYPDLPENVDEYNFQVFRADTDYDPTLLYLRSIMSRDLADQLWESPYMNRESFSWMTSNFWAFFTSDQFVELLEFTGEGFVTDILNRDVTENLALLLGNNFSQYVAEAEAMYAISVALGYDNMAAYAHEQDLVARGMQGTPEWDAMITRWEDIMGRHTALNWRMHLQSELFAQSVVDFIAMVTA